MTLKAWPFLYSVDPRGGLVKNDGLRRVDPGGPEAAAPASLRGDLVARGIKPSGPVPKRIKKAASAVAQPKAQATALR